MADVVSAAAAIAAAVIQGNVAIWEPLKQKLETSNNMDEIYGVMKDAMEKLQAKGDDYKNKVDICDKTTKKPSHTYRKWIRDVQHIEGKVKILSEEYKTERKRSQIFFMARSRFSKKMKRVSLQVINHMEESDRLGDILIDKGPGGVVKTIAPDIKDIPTLQGRLEQILDWLSNTNVRGIRIHGQFGSGKTTIMQNLNNHDKIDQMFDIVIWVTVSREGSKKNLDLHHLQQDIAKRLNFDAESAGHANQVAFRINEELRKRKYLLLLDDVKEDLNFHEIGVPSGNGDSKIVFTTRLHGVCSTIADRYVKVPKLSGKEALKIFKNVLGRPDLEANPYIKGQMPSVVQWCDYLPLTIKVAAGAFRVKETEDSWRYAISKLMTWPERGDDSMSEMFKLLKSCYDYLEGSGRSFFFYSALYPEDSKIDKDCLLNNWVADNLNGDVAEENTRVNGHGILEDLTKASLLEESVCKNYITMHKLIRLAALCNLSADGKGLVKSGEALQKCPNLPEWTQKNWISLVDGKLEILPNEPDSTILSTLFLQKNPNLKIIPAAFFMHMGNLRVLDLHCTGIATLPLSFPNLVNLKALYLNSCTHLVELPSEIEQLQQLQVLDIRGSGLQNVSRQIQNLVRLRRFLLSFVKLDQRDTQNFVLNCESISKISTLKELVIDVKEELDMLLISSDVITIIEPMVKLSTCQFWCQSRVIDVIKVVESTSRIYFPREKDLRSYIGRGNFNLTRFHLFIGCQMSLVPQIPKLGKYCKYIRYSDGKVSYDAISQVLCHADAFELVNHNVEHLSEFTGSMNQVKGCLIESCTKIRTIVDVNVDQGVRSAILQTLKQLYMKKLPTLSRLWEGSLLLPMLKALVLSNCPMMTQVCPYVVIQELPMLKHLEVDNCCGIEELITGSANVGPMVFPKLRTLVLLDMSQLTCILANDSFKWPSLETLTIQRCERLLKLPFRKDGALELGSIKTEKSWWEALENQDVKDHFRKFCTFN